MNVQTIPSVGSNNQASSFSIVKLITTKNTSRTIQPLREQSNYEILTYPEQSFRTFSKRRKPDLLEVIKTMPHQNYYGSMLIISTIHPKKWPELLDRWESDAINALERLPNTLDNVEIVNFIENLLGTTARNMMNSWKINYPNDYNHLIDMTNNLFNITTQVRQIILGTNPLEETRF